MNDLITQKATTPAEMAQMVNDTIPDNADLSLTAPFGSEVI